MDYDLIVVKTLERVYKNYYYIIRGNKTVRKKVTNKTKKILGAFAVAGMLAMSVNSVQAAQEEYTAGSSMGKEYDELEQAYSDDEVLATASNQGHWEVNDAGWWYQYSDGTYPRSSWVNISNKWYYFDENGYMVPDHAILIMPGIILMEVERCLQAGSII